jgi:hypothetical protein
VRQCVPTLKGWTRDADALDPSTHAPPPRSARLRSDEDDAAHEGGLLAPALTLVMDLANSDVEGQRVGLLRVVRPNTDVEHVKNRVGTFASQLNWFGTRADEDAFDLIGDLARPFDAFASELSGRPSAQILACHRRRLLVERVELARDLEDDVHATKASSR